MHGRGIYLQKLLFKFLLRQIVSVNDEREGVKVRFRALLLEESYTESVVDGKYSFHRGDLLKSFSSSDNASSHCDR